MKLFEAVDVWRNKESGSVVRYRCFRVRPSGGYCVQSADNYSAAHTDSSCFERQFVELFSEQAPDERSCVFPTLEEAIEHFDREFGNL